MGYGDCYILLMKLLSSRSNTVKKGGNSYYQMVDYIRKRKLRDVMWNIAVNIHAIVFLYASMLKARHYGIWKVRNWNF